MQLSFTHLLNDLLGIQRWTRTGTRSWTSQESHRFFRRFRTTGVRGCNILSCMLLCSFCFLQVSLISKESFETHLFVIL